MHNTREKPIELLLVEFKVQGFLPPYGTICSIAEDLIANGVTFATDNDVGSKWIPVTERLPDNGTYVNVATDGVVAQAYWHNDRFYAFTAIGVAAVGRVTHWMPLPEPPKGE